MLIHPCNQLAKYMCYALSAVCACMRAFIVADCCPALHTTTSHTILQQEKLIQYYTISTEIQCLLKCIYPAHRYHRGVWD